MPSPLGTALHRERDELGSGAVREGDTMAPRVVGRGGVLPRAEAVTLVAAFFLQSIAVAGGPQPAGEPPPDTADASRDASEVSELPHDPSEAANRSFRSGPPDTTPYSRPIVPEDYAPQGKPAIPPGVTVPAPDESQRKEDDDCDGGAADRQQGFLSTTT